MTTKAAARPTMIAPPNSICGCCNQACQGEAVWIYEAPQAQPAYIHADKKRCLELAMERWKGERDAA